MTLVPEPTKNDEPEVDDTDDDGNTRQRGQASSIVLAEQHRGPLPHPMILEGYDSLVPGTAKRMIDNAIMRAELRTEHERKSANLRRAMEVFSRIMAFVIVCGTIYLGYLLAENGATAVGFALVVTAAGTIAGSFLLYARESRRDSDRIARHNSAPRNSHDDTENRE